MTDTRNRIFMLLVLIGIFAFNATDRLALGIALQNIKQELLLTDTQLGLLTGIAFALFYSLMGVPISRWADRGNRVAIITITTGLWSAAVILCGFAESFVQLLVVRIVVAIGEAGCVPSAVSLIADYYTRRERARAMAFYFQGGALSLLVGYFGGGWLNELYGWRITFTLLGIPGVVLAALAWFTLREPRRTRLLTPSRVKDAESGSPGVLLSCSTLWRNQTFRSILLFFSVGSLFNTGIAQWLPAFFVRSHGMSTGELGTWMALICGLSSMVGAFLGGEWSTRWASNNEARQLRMMTLAFALVGIASILMYVSPNRLCAFSMMFLWNLAGTTTPGPMLAIVQTLVPENMRAMAVALLYLAGNLIGMGLGPLAVGGLSDLLHPRFAMDSLRYALLALSPGYAFACWYLWRASKSVSRDLSAAAEEPHIAPPAVV